MIKSLTVLNGGNDYIFKVGESFSGYKIVEILDCTYKKEGYYLVKFDEGQFEVRAINVIALRIETENSKMFK